jgi:hypothetical protein
MSARTWGLSLAALFLFPGCGGGPSITLPEALSVIHIHPEHGAAEVDVRVQARVIFNRELDEHTVDSDSFFIQRHDPRPGDSERWVDEDAQVKMAPGSESAGVLITPENRLEYDARHRLVVDESVASAHEDALDEPLFSEFQTAPQSGRTPEAGPYLPVLPFFFATPPNAPRPLDGAEKRP